MQRISSLAVLILAWVGIVTASATSSAALASAQNVAVRWLRVHQGATGDQDDLGELKAENPEAYAIVKALLTKRSLGLLDPKHPSASFGAPPPSNSEISGPAAFAKFASPGELTKANHAGAGDQDTSLAYPDVPTAPAHHDWLNWKPQNSATDDEAMVNSVLGEVADLKGKAASALSVKPAASRDSGSSLENDEDLLDSTPPSSSSAPSVADETPQATPAKTQNPYLDSIGLNNQEPSPEPSQTPQRPQLRLASKTTASVRKNAATASENTLSAWLEGKASPGKAAPTQAVATEVPAVAKPEQNPYTVGLW